MSFVISEQLIRRHLDLDANLPEMVDQLTLLGLEVDQVTALTKGLDDVVVGQVLSMSPHPDADRLRICQVQINAQGECLNIVCGAANVEEGMKVPVALLGARLPNGIKMKRSKIRGVESIGMLCSESVLGFAEDSTGILPLSADFTVGESIAVALGLDDALIEIDLTANRRDCMSVNGINRELAAVYQKQPKLTVVKPVEVSLKREPVVDIQAPKLAPVYCARFIEGINLKAILPLAIRIDLQRCGLNSISPVVDIMNWVMLEFGQPLHAFDADQIKGTIVVRSAKAGEKIELLDGSSQTLTEDILVIADDTGPIAMAGLMGNAQSAVSDATTSILIESAFFSVPALLGKGREYGMQTDASMRFEGGVDPELQQQAIDYASALILQYLGGKAGPIHTSSLDDHKPQVQAIELSADVCNQYLGISLTIDQMAGYLQHLGFSVDVKGDTLTATPPSWRFDVAITQDLIEEIARLHGYENLPATLPRFSAQGASQAPEQQQRKLSERLIARGYHEVINYSFQSPEYLAQFDSHSDVWLHLQNPISHDMSVMRTLLIPGLLSSCQKNMNRQQSNIRFYEWGRVYCQSPDGVAAAPIESNHLAGLIAGKRQGQAHWADQFDMDFYDLKGDVEHLLAGLNEEVHFKPMSEASILHPGQSAKIFLSDKKIGMIGAVHPNILAQCGIKSSAYVFEIAVDAILATPLQRFSPISEFPAINRDLAFVLSNTVTAYKLVTVVNKAAGPILKHCQLFDVYQGANLGEGKKSLAINLIFQDLSRTLKDKEVDKAIARVIQKVSETLNAEVRE